MNLKLLPPPSSVEEAINVGVVINRSDRNPGRIKTTNRKVAVTPRICTHRTASERNFLKPSWVPRAPGTDFGARRPPQPELRPASSHTERYKKHFTSTISLRTVWKERHRTMCDYVEEKRARAQHKHTHTCTKALAGKEPFPVNQCPRWTWSGMTEPSWKQLTTR